MQPAHVPAVRVCCLNGEQCLHLRQKLEFGGIRVSAASTCGIGNTGRYVKETEVAINMLQELMFTGTAHYFHNEIAEATLSALSDLLGKDSMKPVQQSQQERIKSWLKEQMVVKFSNILCHPAVHHLILPANLDLRIVINLCKLLPDMHGLTTLDLGGWPCRKHTLLSPPGHQDGYILAFTPNLTELNVSDVSLDFIISISQFCQNLIGLTISKSQVILLKELPSKR